MPKPPNELPIFVKWMDFLDWLMLTTDRFPKSARFTFADRIINLALDVCDDLIEARYSQQKTPFLNNANLRLEKLRVLMRLCQKQHYISYKRYEYAISSINEVGQMVGGWKKQQQK